MSAAAGGEYRLRPITVVVTESEQRWRAWLVEYRPQGRYRRFVLLPATRAMPGRRDVVQAITLFEEGGE